MKSIRCGSNKPTPYLRKWLPTLGNGNYRGGLDLGCGNCRNTHYAISLGWSILPLDGSTALGYTIDLGKENLPVKDNVAELILCNYVLCFLEPIERSHLLKEINRVSKKDAHIFIEMYPAKQGQPYSLDNIINQLGWKVIRKSKDRFMAVK